jgi:hypothetical protein
MTPKEKAHELFDKYNELLSYHIFNGHFDVSKQCALIAVDECLKTCVYSMIYYWEEVKQEIEKL